MSRRKTTPPPTSENPAVKATNAEITRRTNDVYKMLLIGASRADILQHAAKEWNIAERSADEYIARANTLLDAKIEQSQEIEFNRALQRREMLFQKCMTIKDYKAALAVEKDRSELLKLYPAKKTEHTGANGGAIKSETTIILKTGMDIDEL